MEVQRPPWVWAGRGETSERSPGDSWGIKLLCVKSEVAGTHHYASVRNPRAGKRVTLNERLDSGQQLRRVDVSPPGGCVARPAGGERAVSLRALTDHSMPAAVTGAQPAHCSSEAMGGPVLSVGVRER